jgi:phosphoribosyl-AMP cyclohydrolase
MAGLINPNVVIKDTSDEKADELAAIASVLARALGQGVWKEGLAPGLLPTLEGEGLKNLRACRDEVHDCICKRGLKYNRNRSQGPLWVRKETKEATQNPLHRTDLEIEVADPPMTSEKDALRGHHWAIKIDLTAARVYNGAELWSKLKQTLEEEGEQKEQDRKEEGLEACKMLFWRLDLMVQKEEACPHTAAQISLSRIPVVGGAAAAIFMLFLGQWPLLCRALMKGQVRGMLPFEKLISVCSVLFVAIAIGGTQMLSAQQSWLAGIMCTNWTFLFWLVNVTCGVNETTARIPLSTILHSSVVGFMFCTFASCFNWVPPFEWMASSCFHSMAMGGRLDWHQVDEEQWFKFTPLSMLLLFVSWLVVSSAFIAVSFMMVQLPMQIMLKEKARPLLQTTMLQKLLVGACYLIAFLPIQLHGVVETPNSPSTYGQAIHAQALLFTFMLLAVEGAMLAPRLTLHRVLHCEFHKSEVFTFVTFFAMICTHSVIFWAPSLTIIWTVHFGLFMTALITTVVRRAGGIDSFQLDEKIVSGALDAAEKVARTWNLERSYDNGSIVQRPDLDSVVGDSGSKPILGDLVCSSGVHVWRLRVEGSNGVFLGVARSTADASTEWDDNVGCWGTHLANRELHMAGEKQQRSEGPYSFAVPCVVTVRLDCDAGTLSMTVEEEDLGVVCASVPKGEGMRVGVATSNDGCSARLLGHEEESEEAKAAWEVKEAAREQEREQEKMKRGDWWQRESKVVAVPGLDLVVGNSGANPILGDRVCSSGVHVWRLRVEGSNAVLLGVLLRDASTANSIAPPAARWPDNAGCWGASLASRGLYMAGREQQRSAGPDSFAVPCVVTVRLDCDAGTLSMTVGEEDLGVVCASVPKGEGMRVGVGTYNDGCRARLLGHEEEVAEGKQGQERAESSNSLISGGGDDSRSKAKILRVSGGIARPISEGETLAPRMKAEI